MNLPFWKNTQKNRNFWTLFPMPMPSSFEVTSLMLFVRLQEFEYHSAAAIASVVLIASLLLLFVLQWWQSNFLDKYEDK